MQSDEDSAKVSTYHPERDDEFKLLGSKLAKRKQKLGKRNLKMESSLFLPQVFKTLGVRLSHSGMFSFITKKMRKET